MLVLCFSVVFCLGFCFMIWRLAPETVWKNSLDVRFCFWGFVLSSLGFFVEVVFVCFLFKRQRSGSNRTPQHALVWSFFFSFCPAAFVLSPFLAVRPASWCFLGVPFWAPRVFWILLELTGLELARPFRGPPLARVRARGCPSRAEGWSPPFFCCYCLVSCVWFWVTGTQAHCAKSLLFGGGALFGLLPGLSHART